MKIRSSLVSNSSSSSFIITQKVMDSKGLTLQTVVPDFEKALEKLWDILGYHPDCKSPVLYSKPLRDKLCRHCGQMEKRDGIKIFLSEDLSGLSAVTGLIESLYQTVPRRDDDLDED